MQILITHGSLARTRVLRLQPWQLTLAAAGLIAALVLASGAVYHAVFLTAAREGWPVLSPLVRLVVRDEVAQRETLMRENLQAIAQRLGELQAQLIQLEALGDRVSHLAGVSPEERTFLQQSPAVQGAASAPAPQSAASGSGGPYRPVSGAIGRQLKTVLLQLQAVEDDLLQQADLLLLAQARLLESQLLAMMVPSVLPVQAPLGSGFGIRRDPFTGRAALHTGLDFPAAVGTPVVAAAGGIVAASEWHDAYGQMLELDHGNGLRTRYAHLSAIEVPLGAVVRTGEQVGRVGNTGRSTGPHLHFEVLLGTAPQNPARFLAGRASALPPPETALR